MDYPFYVHDLGKIPDQLLEQLQRAVQANVPWHLNELFDIRIIETLRIRQPECNAIRELTKEVRAHLNDWLPAERCVGVNFNRIGAGKRVPEHSDINTEGSTNQMRFVLAHKIHIPIITHQDAVTLHRRSRQQHQKQSFHLQAGHCYLYNDYTWHEVRNDSPVDRIHLLLKYTDPDWTLRQAVLARAGFNPVNSYEVL